MTRQSKLLLMKDLLEHLQECHDEWLAADERTEAYVAQSMERGLSELGRLCDSLRGEPVMA